MLVGVGALAPIALRFGHAGREEYPALTWHIRSDDRDILAAHSGRGYYKKEGKRETGEGGESGRKGEEKGGDHGDQIWTGGTPLGNRTKKGFAASPCRPILTCIH